MIEANSFDLSRDAPAELSNGLTIHYMGGTITAENAHGRQRQPRGSRQRDVHGAGRHGPGRERRGRRDGRDARVLERELRPAETSGARLGRSGQARDGGVHVRRQRAVHDVPGRQSFLGAARARYFIRHERGTRHRARREARFQRRADPLLAVLLVSDRRPAQERLPDPEYRPARSHRTRSVGAVLLQHRAEPRRHRATALHEQARRPGAQRVSLPDAGDHGAAELRISAERRRDPRDSSIHRLSSADSLRRRLAAQRRHRGRVGRDIFRGSRPQPRGREPDALEPVRRSDLLRARVVIADARPGLSDARLDAHGRRAPVPASAADGVRGALARPANRLRCRDRARELRSQRRRNGLAARLDGRVQHAVRALGHVSHAGCRVAPDELLARPRHARARRG